MSEQESRAAPEVSIADIVLPNQTNNHGTMFGGDVMALMDRAAGIAALRFCRRPVVTASTERIDFRTPIERGEIIEALARVIYIGRTSMIVRIHIYAEHPLIGKRRLCTTGYFSMVAIDEQGRPVAVPRLKERRATPARCGATACWVRSLFHTWRWMLLCCGCCPMRAGRAAAWKRAPIRSAPAATIGRALRDLARAHSRADRFVRRRLLIRRLRARYHRLASRSAIRPCKIPAPIVQDRDLALYDRETWLI